MEHCLSTSYAYCFKAFRDFRSDSIQSSMGVKIPRVKGDRLSHICVYVYSFVDIDKLIQHIEIKQNDKIIIPKISYRMKKEVVGFVLPELHEDYDELELNLKIDEEYMKKLIDENKVVKIAVIGRLLGLN